MSIVKKSILKCLQSFRFALRGIIYAIRQENNFIYHLLATFTITCLGIYLEFSRMEWLIVVICITTVYAAEIFNTAIEKLVDMVSPNHRRSAGIVKDLSAGAVLVASLGALICGLIILSNHFSS
ncbi:diacylglycerol kinase family protein [Fulvivirgaceae bacterium BMA10]|uniref:Diacylglycerol kinase family protein n=1 Tax=Splendidivirga corallicola TaxID=3051826 RepID=A0ABT8KIA2_9BACT|nr:diacylglycerol kinase family protein [Fulvivirgaceae bacterium BMA10]